MRWISRRTFIPLSLILAVTSSALAQPTTQPAKKLIEFGWDEPSAAFMRAHIQEMEQTPFDGCVFHIDARKPDGSTGRFSWECWGRSAFTEAQLAPALVDLQATAFKKFTDNFLRLNVTPADVDWFDDFSPILSNVELAARVTRAGRCKGLLFDTEQYDKQLFTYRKQRDARTKSWEQYANQARLRGQEVMRALQKGYPDITVMFTFSYSLLLEYARGDPKKLAETEYGLLAPFLDGMLAEAKGDTRLIDGYELSYNFDDLSEFPPAYEKMRRGVLPLVANPERYKEYFSAGFGIWLDFDWRKKGWDEKDVSKNFYTPEKFEATVREALKTSDEYVWIYSEQPRWWTDEGQSVKLPAAYEKALRAARSPTTKLAK